MTVWPNCGMGWESLTANDGYDGEYHVLSLMVEVLGSNASRTLSTQRNTQLFRTGYNVYCSYYVDYFYILLVVYRPRSAQISYKL